MSNTDRHLTMAKYSNNDNKDVNNMMEEERRSKAYSKIIGAQTSQTFVSWYLLPKKKFHCVFTFKDADSERSTLTDIFCNTNGFSAKTVQAIYKETLYKVKLFIAAAASL